MNSFCSTFPRFRWLPALQYYSCVRHICNSNSIGLNEYVRARNKIQFKTDQDKINFRNKMIRVVDADENSLIFSEDLKQMIHLAEPVENDLSLVEKMMVKFHKKNANLRFGSYTFGPVIMRMYYYMNKPQEALNIYYNPGLEGFFDQLSTHVILMDLLFNNEMYQEVIEVYNTTREKQLTFGKFPKSILVLVFGSLYKLNTEESFKYMMHLWNEMQEKGHEPIRRVVCFAAALALNQNSADKALELLAVVHHQSFVLVRSIKILANNALGRIDEALIVMASVVIEDTPNTHKQTIPVDVLSVVRENVKKQNNKEWSLKFDRVEKQLKDFDHISNQTLDELLSGEVTIINPVNSKKSVIRASFYNSNYALEKYHPGVRPGLEELI